MREAYALSAHGIANHSPQQGTQPQPVSSSQLATSKTPANTRSTQLPPPRHRPVPSTTLSLICLARRTPHCTAATAYAVAITNSLPGLGVYQAPSQRRVSSFFARQVSRIRPTNNTPCLL